MRLGKIKCAAKALACVSACSSFNFAKGWHFVHCFLSVYVLHCRSVTLAPNAHVCAGRETKPTPNSYLIKVLNNHKLSKSTSPRLEHT